jgi:hypothetical protein
MSNFKPHGISQATLKYQNVDVALREQKRKEWNQPVLWPLFAMLLLLFFISIPGYLAYRSRLSRRIAVPDQTDRSCRGKKQ